MKKQLFTLIVLSLSACVAVAQPTLTATNSNPVIGDAFVAVNCDTTGITAPGTGTGFVWDYSTLRATLTDTAYGLACTSTPYCSMFPGTTISTKSLNGGNYGYLIANTSKLSQNGTYYNTTDYLTFSNPMDQFRYPFTFGTGFTDTMAGLLVKSGIVFHQTGTESVTCDGYGTLTLPGGVVDTGVLRVHSVQYYVDSANLFGFDTIINLQMDVYAWYKPNFHSALLTISIARQVGGTLNSKLVSYAKRYTMGIADPNRITPDDITLSPNPATSALTISYPTTVTDVPTAYLTDITGKKIHEVEFTATKPATLTANLSTLSLPKGLYLAHIANSRFSTVKKVVIE